jgi:hypothetical protein
MNLNFLEENLEIVFFLFSLLTLNSMLMHWKGADFDGSADFKVNFELKS